MDRLVSTDAQWAKMEPHCLGKPGDPGRSGDDNRRFVEAILWIVRTGSPWRDIPPSFGNWSTIYTRFATGRRPTCSPASSRPSLRSRTWTRWWMRPSSRSTATARAQKGEFEPGHRPLQRRHDDKDPRLDGRARQLVRFVLLPGQRYDTVGVAALIEGVSFGALIADKAFDSNAISPTSINAAPRRSSRRTRAAPNLSSSTPRCTNNVT